MPPKPKRVVEYDSAPNCFQIATEDLPPQLSPRKGQDERLQACYAIRKDLVNKITYIIDLIKQKLAANNIELRLSNVVVLSLHLQIYIRAHLDIQKDIVMAIDYVADQPSFYLLFPLMHESIFIEAGYGTDITI